MALPRTVQQTIDEALAEMQREIGEVLVKHAADAAIAGDAGAQKAITGTISWDLVDRAALGLMKEYAANIAKGGSICTVKNEEGKTSREFVPWLEDSTKSTRDKLAELIQQAIEGGQGLGVKEGSAGYQPGTLAEQLKDLFNERKSQAATVARTEMSGIRNDAAFARYVEAGIEQVEITGPDDDLTCEDCGLIVGEVYDIADAPYIPDHPNCRHGVAPVVPAPEMIAA
jgi:SPP1 gp7 family putative phage head morphogenesis protein